MNVKLLSNLKTKLFKMLFKKSEKSPSFQFLARKWEKRRKELLNEFEDKHAETAKWLSEKGIDVDEVLKRGTRGTMAAVAASMIMLSSGITPERQLSKLSSEKPEVGTNRITSDIKAKEVVDKALAEALIGKLPESNRPLTVEEEREIITSVREITGVRVAAELADNRLNTNYGKIGLEQHLPRYPGETITEHFNSANGRAAYGKSGMTKNRGALGYFAPNKYALTTEAIEKEKYYAVVQTFAIAGWDRSKSEWYRHRKVLIVNPANGKSVVAVIADSGPSRSTGKNFGGSPEAMDALGIYYGNYKNPVLLFFIDETDGRPKGWAS